MYRNCHYDHVVVIKCAHTTLQTPKYLIGGSLAAILKFHKHITINGPTAYTTLQNKPTYLVGGPPAEFQNPQKT